jgi:branched-chain amino acid transport system substrate-binding protein
MQEVNSCVAYPVQLVAGNGLTAEDFGLIAWARGRGNGFRRCRRPARTRRSGAGRGAVPSVRFRATRLHPLLLCRHSGVAQATEKAGSLGIQMMIAALRQHRFDTVLGPIDFDDKGDLAVQNMGLYVWHADGTYVPL